MKKFLSILLVLMLAVLPAMAEQTGIQAERKQVTVEFTAAELLPGFSIKAVEDIQNGEYEHVLQKVYLNGEEIMSVGAMLDGFAKKLFVSYPAVAENVMVFDEEDLNKIVNTLAAVLEKELNELKNDPEFILTMAQLMEAFDEALDQAIVEGEALAEQRAAEEALLASLNYDKLFAELERIFTPAKEIDNNVTKYSFTFDQQAADQLVAAIGAFFAENQEALGAYAIDENTMAEFKMIVDELMSAMTVTGSVMMDDKGDMVSVDVKLNVREEGENITLGLTALDVKQGENEDAVIGYDIKVNGESIGLFAVVEAQGDDAVVRILMPMSSAEAGTADIELAKITVDVEDLEPNILYVEGGETVAPMKLSNEELDQFMKDAGARMEALSTEVNEKVEAIMETIMAPLMGEEPAA